MFKWIKNNPVRSMFLIPILLVATISIFHVVTWYNLSNPLNWAIFLSVAIEVGAITALIAVTNRIKGGVWFMFILVTLIQMVGNIFYSYKEIDENGELFKSWVELTYPLWEMLGTEETDIVGLKRWLSFLTGGLLPIISLTSLHFFVKYEDPNQTNQEDTPKIDDDKTPNNEVDKTEPTKLSNSEQTNQGSSNENKDDIKESGDKISTKKVTVGNKFKKTWRNIINVRNKKTNSIGRIDNGDRH